MIITFTGFDGAGKSTNTKLLIERLEKDYNFKGVSVLDMTDGNEVYSSLGELLSLKEKLKFYDVIDSRFYMRSAVFQQKQMELMYSDEEIFKKSNFALDVAKGAYQEAVIWYEYVIKELLALGKIVIYDRYYYDEIAYRSLYNLDMDIIAKLYSTYRKPDMSFYLRGNIETIFDRNRDREDMNTALFKSKEKMVELFGKLEDISVVYNLAEISIEGRTREDISEEVYSKVKNKLMKRT